MITFLEWLLAEEKELVPAQVKQTYENAFKQALQRFFQRTKNPILKEKVKEMLDCPIRDRRGRCRSFTDYIVGALVRNGITDSHEIQSALGHVAERMLMHRQLGTGEGWASVLDDFDESRPFDPDTNPLQARLLGYLRWAITDLAKRKVKEFNAERRPKGTVSITSGRQR